MVDVTRRDGASLLRLLRLVFLVVVTVLAQTLVFPNLRVFGVVPDVGLVLAVAIAYSDGPETGALFGFVQGLAVDLFLNTPFGLSALAFGMTAFLVGILQTGLVRTSRWMPVLLGVGAGLVSGAIFVCVGALVGQERLFELDSARIVALAAAYDGVIAPACFPLARWALHRSSP